MPICRSEGETAGRSVMAPSWRWRSRAVGHILAEAALILGFVGLLLGCQMRDALLVRRIPVEQLGLIGSADVGAGLGDDNVDRDARSAAVVASLAVSSLAVS